jgi:hypothetical protein
VCQVFSTFLLAARFYFARNRFLFWTGHFLDKKIDDKKTGKKTEKVPNIITPFI